MAIFAITSILLTYYLISFGNCIYLPSGQNFIPNAGNQLSGSAGGGAFPSASSTIQNGQRDLPSSQNFIPYAGNQLSGSAGSGSFPSGSSTIQNRQKDLPSSQNFIPNAGNQLSGAAGGGAFPPGNLPFQNGRRDIPYYLPRYQEPGYEKGITGPERGSSPFPDKYAVNPPEPGPTFPSITVTSVNNAVSTNSAQPNSDQSADLGSDLDDF